ncbi:hypothetical protein FGO68_gene1614 [Halteria grandinella]|uniref:Uncharacterized protein n=1 Tax=Halteria grandinella TaxID=5974 RepID=A0A8J8NJ19_HALGN|nr:hypothetical protein FGO68_gene1614 [Halteria grandinella]
MMKIISLTAQQFKQITMVSTHFNSKELEQLFRNQSNASLSKLATIQEEEQTQKDHPAWSKMLPLCTSTDHLLRIMKVFQFMGVIFSEFAVARYLNLFLRGQRRMRKGDVLDWNDRFKKLGISMSTLRMSLRMFQILQVAKFFNTYKRNKDQPIPVLRLLQVVVNTVCSIADNWFYLGRIGLYKWTSPAEEYLMSQIATVTAVIALIIDFVNEALVILQKRVSNPEFSIKKYILKERRDWFACKILDFPVYVYYSDVTTFQKGHAHLISLATPLIQLYKHFTD